MAYKLFEIPKDSLGREQLNCYIDDALVYRFVRINACRWAAFHFNMDSGFVYDKNQIDQDQYRNDLAERLEMKHKGKS